MWHLFDEHVCVCPLFVFFVSYDDNKTRTDFPRDDTINLNVVAFLIHRNLVYCFN